MSQPLEVDGEPVGIRTRDLLIKSQLLYQLSYRPTQGGCIETSYPVVKGEIGDTSCLSGKNLKGRLKGGNDANSCRLWLGLHENARAGQ